MSEARDIPIIFSAPMVLALLAGRKTQTRRLAWRAFAEEFSGDKTRMVPTKPSAWQRVRPGDRLWVRESVRAEEHPEEDIAGVRYLADYFWQPTASSEKAREDWFRLDTYGTTDPITGGRPVPSIHMPRWASRLTLTTTEVRVMPLQAMNRGDAMEEGCPFSNMADGPSPRDWFRDLWSNLHGPDAWAANPEVVALTFTVEQRNIDAHA